MICFPPYNPPVYLRNGFVTTVYTSLWGRRNWQKTIADLEPLYHKTVLMGGQDVPIFCLRLKYSDIGGVAVICPNLDAARSLNYLVRHPIGKYLEQVIAKNLKILAWQIHENHPGTLDPDVINRLNTIWDFDNELVIQRLGFPSVEAYYAASSPLQLLPQISKSSLIIYAADDPLFHLDLVSDLQAACRNNPNIDLLVTPYGGHMGYLNSQ